MKNCNKGQSLIELLIAMAVFVLVVSAITFLILDSYIAHRAGREVTLATFLAEEGLEATRSIRDNDWDDLIDGNHGIATSIDGWIFQGTEEDISNQLGEGIRKVIVESLDADRKKVQSQITWEFTRARPQEIILVTYLTNWQKEVFTVSFSSETYSIPEDGGNLTVEVVLFPTSSDVVSVDYETIEDIATEPEDYTFASGTLIFNPGDISQTFDVTIIDDIEVEPDETFGLILSSPQNVELGDPNQATAIILDNDGAPPDCWGITGSCDPLCQYSDYGPLTDYYTDPDPLCNDSCPPAGSFYADSTGPCSNDGTGSCYKMENPSSQYTSSTQGDSCEGDCSGTCTPCRRIRNEEQCRQQDGCIWSFVRCFDSPGCTSCDTYTEEDPCLGQLGCSWESIKWYWNLSDIQDGYSPYINCEWYEW